MHFACQIHFQIELILKCNIKTFKNLSSNNAVFEIALLHSIVIVIIMERNTLRKLSKYENYSCGKNTEKKIKSNKESPKQQNRKCCRLGLLVSIAGN